MSLQHYSHSRQNLLTGEWVLVSPERTLRPWQGQVEEMEASTLPRFDPDCYLCPGNRRANGTANPHYAGPYAFDNDFSALSATSTPDVPANALQRVRAESGTCRVLCYTEHHDLRLSTMSTDDVTIAIDAMIGEFRELDRRDDIGYVQIFENRGRMMGCSNPHPHAQIWATAHLPNEPAKELATQSAYYEENAKPLLLDYLRAELEDDARIVCRNEHSVAMVPYWAVWPFETLILPRRQVAAPDELDEDEVAALAETLKTVLRAYDSLFQTACPYSLGLHPRPSDGESHPEWLFHAHIYPPLLRSAVIRKHLVGFEMLAMPQRDLTPESAAAKLRGEVPKGRARPYAS